MTKVKTLDQIRAYQDKLGLRVRWLTEDRDREPVGTITDAGEKSVTITWQDAHPPSVIERERWRKLEVV